MTKTRLDACATLAAVLSFASCVFGQSSAPADAEAYERTLREERVRHLDLTRRLADEEDRLRVALDAAKSRLAEAEARRGSLRRLVAEAEAAAEAVARRIAEGRAALAAVARSVVAAADRFTSTAAVPAEARADGAPLARRVRLLFQALDREIGAGRTVTVTAHERNGALGHEVRLGLLGRFFVPAAGGR